MPKPKKQFSRPSINLTPVGREWRLTLPTDLRTGDTVADVGLLKGVHPGTGYTHVVNLLNYTHDLKHGKKVWAYVLREEADGSANAAAKGARVSG